MSIFRVDAEVTISISTLVEAGSKEQALKIALTRGMPTIYEDCPDETEEWVTSGELDGEPRALTATEEP